MGTVVNRVLSSVQGGLKLRLSRTSAPLVKVNSTYMKSDRVNLVAPASPVQGTMCKNAQLIYTQIVYCTLLEKCKQTQCPHRS